MLNKSIKPYKQQENELKALQRYNEAYKRYMANVKELIK